MDALCKLELKANKADLPSVLSALELAQNDINSIEVNYISMKKRSFFTVFFLFTNSFKVICVPIILPPTKSLVPPARFQNPHPHPNPDS